MKSLRAPERVFGIVMWLVSIAFAAFLVGLGGRVLADLPRIETSLTVDDYVADPAALATLEREQARVAGEQRSQEAARAQAELRVTTASNAWGAAQTQFRNWIATRVATTDPAQDPEVIARTRDLDRLKNEQRAAEIAGEDLDRSLLDLSQTAERQAREMADMRASAWKTYQRALFWQELRVFLVRLAMTLPLLVLAAWLVARKRRAEYWPLMRGFVLFATFTFFVELVPYLPSYGGYVRYGVGVLLTAVAGHYVIRSMRRYLARRQEAERQTESERRHAIKDEEALKKIGANVCPGCERPIQTTGQAPANFCVHCGMTLFDTCRTCATRKNVFFRFCPACGTTAAAAPPAA